MNLRNALLGPPVPLRVVEGRTEVFGIPFSPLSRPGFVAEVARRLSQGERGVTLLTPDARAAAHILLRPQRTRVYRESDLVACDGTGLAWAARACGRPLPRVPGVDLAWDLCCHGAHRGWTVYLLGGSPGVAEAAARTLRAALPGIRVVGQHHGYFSGPGPAEEVRRLQPDLLLVGMGFPRQEQWILAHRSLGAGLLIGVGGTFEVWSGRIPRAPATWRRVGLEWLWKALLRPRRLLGLWCVPFLLYHIALGWLRTKLVRGEHVP
ncbi:MAG: WecB/TagA/CpsF family glycosyltransferase [Candidatus Bipolaricaulaceae bacterium]